MTQFIVLNPKLREYKLLNFTGILAFLGRVEVPHACSRQFVGGALGIRQHRVVMREPRSCLWMLALMVLSAAALIGLWPLSLLGEAGRWGWAPSEILLFVVAGGIAGVAAMLGWFWLIRLSAAAPADTRGRVFAAFLLIIPAMVAGVTLGWWFGLNRLLAIVFDRLNMSF